MEVDEEQLRAAMLEVPAMRHRRPPGAVALLGEAATEEPMPVETAPTETAVVAPTPVAPAPVEPEPVKRGPYRKKRPEADNLSYCERFLVNDGARFRVNTAIDRTIHTKMKRVLSMVAPDVTIVSYISNVLAHHLDRYDDEINALYRNETDKPL